MTVASITPAFQPALETALRRRFGDSCRIVHLEQRPAPYRSSFRLEELEVRLETGALLSLMFKDLSPQALLEGARDAKPGFLYDPHREIAMYRSLLDSDRDGTPACYGDVEDEEQQRYWLFLERVPGLALWQIGERSAWLEAARRLARMHARSWGQAGRAADTVPLIRYDEAFYRRWPQRAQAYLRQRDAAAPAEAVQALDRVAARYDRVLTELLPLPETVIHGECYASNIIIQEASTGMRMCLVDWEMAGRGPGLIDLAALTSGRWTDTQRAELAMAYYAALQEAGGSVASSEQFLHALDCCRLHLALQQLGWSPTWSAPPEHAYDWLGEALGLAERLELLR